MVLIRPESFESENPDDSYNSYKLKSPKRVLHFSDGTLEEYSTDEEDNSPPPTQEIVDPSKMSWGPWMLFKTWSAGNSTLSFVDYLGETLAAIFGITTPRYYFELEEYKRRQANAAEQADKEKGWCDEKNQIVDAPLKASLNRGNSQPKIEEV